MSFGLIVTEVCCHKINMNTKEKDIIKRILNRTAMDSVRQTQEVVFMEIIY